MSRDTPLKRNSSMRFDSSQQGASQVLTQNSDAALQRNTEGEEKASARKTDYPNHLKIVDFNDKAARIAALKALAKNKRYTGLVFKFTTQEKEDNQQFDAEEGELLAQLLQANPAIQEIIFHFDVWFPGMSAFISKLANSSIHILRLFYAGVEVDNMIFALLNCLQNLSLPLTRLMIEVGDQALLNSQNIMPEARVIPRLTKMNELVEIMRRCPFLAEFGLRGVRMSRSSFQLLVQEIRKKKILYVSLCDNELGYDYTGVSALFPLLQQQTVEYLHLRRNSMGTDRLCLLLVEAQKSRALRNLDLSGNDTPWPKLKPKIIAPEAIKLLQQKKLRSFKIDYAALGIEYALLVIETLKVSHVLETLHLVGLIPQEELLQLYAALQEALKTNTSLIDCQLDYISFPVNPWNDAAVFPENISAALKRNLENHEQGKSRGQIAAFYWIRVGAVLAVQRANRGHQFKDFILPPKKGDGFLDMLSDFAPAARNKRLLAKKLDLAQFVVSKYARSVIGADAEMAAVPAAAAAAAPPVAAAAAAAPAFLPPPPPVAAAAPIAPVGAARQSRKRKLRLK